MIWLVKFTWCRFVCLRRWICGITLAGGGVSGEREGCGSVVDPNYTTSKRIRLSRHRMNWLLTHTLPPSTVSKLSLFLSLPVCRRSSLLTGEGGGGDEGGAKSYDGEKAWSSVNPSILSGWPSSSGVSRSKKWLIERHGREGLWQYPYPCLQACLWQKTRHKNDSKKGRGDVEQQNQLWKEWMGEQEMNLCRRKGILIPPPPPPPTKYLLIYFTLMSNYV